jgi:hypothetical protein
MGVYKRLSDVPDRYRLNHHAAAYEGRDAWAEFVTTKLAENDYTDRYEQDICRAGRRWKEHMAACGRHHALATPKDVNKWCIHLLDTYTVRYAVERHWNYLEQFYRSLLWHTEHPHVYLPVLMAAAEYDAASELWEYKMAHTDRILKEGT